MKILTALGLLISAQLIQAQTISELQWLSGKWERTNVRAGQTAFEIWNSTKGNELTGMGITMRGKDTVFIEKLKIIIKDEALHYVAEVSHNQQPTYFKITSLSEGGFICENPQHDFPKKIEYTLKGNEMTAVISGNGKQMGFSFKKVN